MAFSFRSPLEFTGRIMFFTVVLCTWIACANGQLSKDGPYPLVPSNNPIMRSDQPDYVNTVPDSHLNFGTAAKSSDAPGREPEAIPRHWMGSSDFGEIQSLSDWKINLDYRIGYNNIVGSDFAGKENLKSRLASQPSFTQAGLSGSVLRRKQFTKPLRRALPVQSENLNSLHVGLHSTNIHGSSKTRQGIGTVSELPIQTVDTELKLGLIPVKHRTREIHATDVPVGLDSRTVQQDVGHNLHRMEKRPSERPGLLPSGLQSNTPGVSFFARNNEVMPIIGVSLNSQTKVKRVKRMTNPKALTKVRKNRPKKARKKPKNAQKVKKPKNGIAKNKKGNKVAKRRGKGARKGKQKAPGKPVQKKPWKRGKNKGNPGKNRPRKGGRLGAGGPGDKTTKTTNTNLVSPIKLRPGEVSVVLAVLVDVLIFEDGSFIECGSSCQIPV